MSDVSSMFIVYLLELLTWHDDPYSQQVVKELYNASKKAAQWHIAESTAEGFPSQLVDTYDILGLNAYPYDAYTGGFHLLAMKAAETLAYAMSMYSLLHVNLFLYFHSVTCLYYVDDAEFAEECNKAFVRGQQALDRILWNETARHYNAYTPNKPSHTTGVQSRGAGTDTQKRYGANVTYEANPDPLGAIMTDTFYSQVICCSEMNVKYVHL